MRFYVGFALTLFTDVQVKISAVDFLMCVGFAPKAPVRKKESFVSFSLKRNSPSGGNEPGEFQKQNSDSITRNKQQLMQKNPEIATAPTLNPALRFAMTR